MSARVSPIEPHGALCEIHTDEPLCLVGARFRAHGVTGVHIEQRGRRRWLVVDKLPLQPLDHEPEPEVVELREAESPPPWWALLGLVGLTAAAALVLGALS